MKFFLLLILALQISCGGNNGSSGGPPSEPNSTTPEVTQEKKNPLESAELITPEGRVIRTSIAYTSSDQTKGLQGVQEKDFAEDEGKLFFYLSTNKRTFWMPNTYFNLDIIYLDENLKITEIVWNLPHYTGTTSSEIPRAPSVTSRHVLEMKAGSEISSSLQVGDNLQWSSPLSLDETEAKIRAAL